jgi:hypothetical protein
MHVVSGVEQARAASWTVPPPLELLPPDVPPSLGPGALQTITPSDGSAASGPQVSPGPKHSVDAAQSWMGPMGVDGQGPAWQFVVMVIAPQQIWPLGQTAAFVHATPLLLPALLVPLWPVPLNANGLPTTSREPSRVSAP